MQKQQLSVHPVEIRHSPSLPEPACSTSEMQGSTEIRRNDSPSTHLVPSCDDDESEQSKSIQRKRLLPSWMLEKDLLVPKISEPITKGGGRNKESQRRGGSNVESLKSEVNILQGKRSASEEIKENSGDEEQDEEEGRCLSSSSLQNASGFPLESTMGNIERNGKTETKKPGSSMEKSDGQRHSKRPKPSGQISSKTNELEESEDKGQLTCSASQQAPWGRTSPNGAQEGAHDPNADVDYDTEISYSTKGAEASESSKQRKCKRTPCMYGAGCYRYHWTAPRSGISTSYPGKGGIPFTFSSSVTLMMMIIMKQIVYLKMMMITALNVHMELLAIGRIHNTNLNTSTLYLQ
ncbi:aprataxin and PNK-like factor isoform X2 [Excalfactoria chinensis]|uniref:aprataxin and PNK-like factor isoform X2 n=1 Tax=Excalfactoria chinensis TaxID=46218 RepID=UPI003B39FF1B